LIAAVANAFLQNRGSSFLKLLCNFGIGLSREAQKRVDLLVSALPLERAFA
jgi:hypothetical protein